MNLVRLWESRNLNVYMYMCAQVYLVPIPYDSKSVSYTCTCNWISVDICLCICICFYVFLMHVDSLMCHGEIEGSAWRRRDSFGHCRQSSEGKMRRALFGHRRQHRDPASASARKSLHGLTMVATSSIVFRWTSSSFLRCSTKLGFAWRHASVARQRLRIRPCHGCKKKEISSSSAWVVKTIPTWSSQTMGSRRHFFAVG